MHDIVFVIENNALFDVEVPATRGFHEQQLTIDAWNIDLITTETLERAAAVLSSRWRAALNNAARLGVDALRDPELGRRAAKTAKMVSEGSTYGERQAAAQALDGMLVALRIVVPARPSRPS